MSQPPLLLSSVSIHSQEVTDANENALFGFGPALCLAEIPEKLLGVLIKNRVHIQGHCLDMFGYVSGFAT